MYGYISTMTAFITYLPVGSIASVGESIASAYKLSNMAGKVIVDVLFIGSILAWSIMVTKIKELRQARKVSELFLSAYRKEAHPVSLFLKRQKYEVSPLYVIYEKICVALGAALEARGADPNDLFMGGVGSTRQKLDEIQVNSIRNMVERMMSDQALLLESNMGWLATAVTMAPSLGLLGTVWGVMESFGAMAVTGAAMLSAVAPGISGALLTTVVGLLVALPSAAGYNMLTIQIRQFCVEMDNFSEEIISDVERHYVQER